MRRGDAAHWERGAGNTQDHSRQGDPAPGYLRDLRLWQLQAKRRLCAGHANPERTGFDSRELRLRGGRRAHCGAEIRHGLSALPAGAGMEPPGRHAFQADHVQLAAALCRRLACADLRRTAEAAALLGSSTRGRDRGTGSA